MSAVTLTFELMTLKSPFIPEKSAKTDSQTNSQTHDTQTIRLLDASEMHIKQRRFETLQLKGSMSRLTKFREFAFSFLSLSSFYS